MKRFICSFAGITGLLFSWNVSAQKNKQNYPGSYPEFSLSTSLTSFFDYDAGVMLGVNYRWSKHFSASLAPTWIFYSFYADGNSKIIPSGIKIRADLKYYFRKRKSRHPDFYIAPEFHYKYTETRKEDLFGINCQNGQCPFFQNAIYTDIKNEMGGLVKSGLITPIRVIKNNRWLIDIYVGLGVKQLKFRETGLPVGGSFVNVPGRGPFNNTIHNFALPTVPAGIKLIFVL